MDDVTKQELMRESLDFFRDTLVENSRTNISKLAKLPAHDLNPFLVRYRAAALRGEVTPRSVAESLVYPRALGTSINTSFGMLMQRYVREVLGDVLGSTTSGMDIEFIDALDGRRKYCQLKGGPRTINKDDVPTILGHFRSAMNLAIANGVPVQVTDFVVGVIYGTEDSLSQFYRDIRNENYPVLVGADFWEHLTGDPLFYTDLARILEELADACDIDSLIETTVMKLASEIESSGMLDSEG